MTNKVELECNKSDEVMVADSGLEGTCCIDPT